MVAVGEIAIAIAVVGWFLAPTIKELMDSARSSLGSRYKWYTGLAKKLRELAGALDEINFTVGAANVKGNFINDPAMIDLLWGLKDAIHDAEELLDTFQYEILDANLNLEKRHPVRRAMDSTVDFWRQVIGTKESLNKLKELMKQLVLLRQSSGNLVQASKRGSRPISRPVTSHLQGKDKRLFGYDKEYKDQLVSRLISRDGDSRVIAIIGHAGTGKTELARQAFHDPNLEFSLRIWVSVYAKFSATELLREIWGSTPIEAKPHDSRMRESNNMNLTSLQEELTKMMKSGRRCLLVLDDVCYDESASASDLSRRNTWDTVLAPFEHHSEKGNRILITSRAGICCETLGAGAPIVLNGIDTDAITLLLKKACFGNEDAPPVPKKLQRLFHNLVLKINGSPLAAEEVGCMLKGVDPAKWKDKLNSGFLDGVRYAHLSSYQDLPPHLQRCFAFCSIFPINWRFQREKLIRMWVALGFIECPLSESGVKKPEEDVAEEYFHALLRRSFFKEAARVKGKSGSGFYVIHEHTHSMLRLVSPRTYLTIDANRDRGAGIPLTVRHLSVTTSCLDQLKHCGEWTNLRTLLVFNDHDASKSPESASVTAIDNGVLKKFKGVRVLDFSDTSVAQLPESVGKLKHLRYLDLPNTITKLGCHVTKLLLLQTFSVNKNGRFHELEDLPDEMSNLTNLRHLDLYMKCIEKVERIGRLEKLQGSVEFRAGKSEEGHGIRELEKLNSLRRILSIKGLDTVKSRKEAESAELHKKEYLKVLKLEWEQQTLQQQNQREAAAANDSAVLEGLKPHPNLEKLHIIRYIGIKTPAWLENPSVLANLRALYLTNCRNLQVLPLVGDIPCLELLTISELCSVKRIDSLFSSGAFSSLEKMVLYDMPMLDAWNEGVGIGTQTLFPRLREVKIVHCPKLCSVSGLLSCRHSLRDLHVETCPRITQTFSKSSFPLLNDFSKLLGCPGLQFEDSPAEPAEGAAAPCPTQDGGRRCTVPTRYHLFIIFVSSCLLYSIGSFFSTAIV